MTWNEPNRKSPRYRRNLKKIINPEFLKRLKREHPGLSLSNKDIRLIIDTFHQLCKDVITETRDGLELLEQLGTITLTRCKPVKVKLMDERKAAIYKKKFPIPGWLCKIRYSNKSNKYKFKNAQLWAFEAGRPFKKQASECFTKDYTKYIISDRLGKLAKEYRENQKILKPIVEQNILNNKVD